MFDILIYQKQKVKVSCGNDTITGVISNHYEQFGLIKMNNVLLPIEHILMIEVVEEESDPFCYAALPSQAINKGASLREMLY
ncbi:hypothetical protein [Paenibacillus sp. UNC499MF]|uniref:hypothetical protein n=1 Tax=Paenibacillus sp. UNC499MF TaxID=1502751 RepID=UPI00089FCB08|nr:hypothetical protein [Paenibacillus sp. UNC499MF]SEF88198.1 hypothetical protein SAMN02799616_01320 [Paenibacillus sp. UNC499MF]